MNDPFFSLTQLKYLIELDKHKSFHKAAAACHVSQPTLSMQVQKLEEYYNTPFFRRTKRSVITTKKGKDFINNAKKILAEAEYLHTKLIDKNSDIAGEYRLALIPTVAPFLLPLFVDQLKEKYPKAHLTIQEMQTGEILKALKEDEIDFAILATPLHMASIKEQPLYYENFLFYLPPKSPLLKKKELSVKELPTKELLLLEDGHCFRDQALDICNTSRDDTKAFNLKTGSIQTLLHLCNKQGYTTFLPELSLEYLSPSQKKQARKLRPHLYREISIVSNNFHYKDKLIQLFAEEIQKSLPPYIKTKKPSKIVDVV